jgi:hypothetical protein
MDENWRVLVTFGTKADARADADLLRTSDGVTDAGGSVSYSRGSAGLFLYAPTSERVESVARVLRAAVDALGIEPTGVSVGQWLEGVTRWSDDEDAVPAGDDHAVDNFIGWIETIVYTA